MRRFFSYCLASAFLFVCLFANLKESYSNSVEELTPEKLVAEHVKSVGRPALLEKIQSRTFLGTSNVEFIQGMRGARKGTSVFVSQGPKVGIIMKYDDNSYPGEYFAYDGKDVTVGHMSPGQRSPIGDFIFRFNKLVKGGFIGGALTSSWPLLDLKNKNVDMKYRRAKIEGRELHELEYHPKAGFGDIKIRMYFDLTTFRHVRTEYKVQSTRDASVALGGSKDDSFTADPNKAFEDVRGTDPSRPTSWVSGDPASNNSASFNNASSSTQMGGIGQDRPDSHYTLVERFEDYKREGGLMLPHRYVLEYSAEGAGQPFIGHWFINIDKWAFNAANVDQKLFKALK
jgi:hypothetical protein